MTTPTDLVVVLPGILGSTLRHRDHLVWSPSAGSVLRAITTLGRSLRDLQLPDDIGDNDPADGVQPAGLMPDLHLLPGIWTPIKGYDRLLARLRSLGYRDTSPDPDAPPGNLLPVPYDWRLSNRYNGQRLAGIVEPALERWRAQGGPYTDATLTFVCHSMGGLIARWYIEHCGGADITGKLITLGTPYRGAAKALEQLVNGTPTGLGALAIDLTQLIRSMPSMYQLLPEYACLEHGTELAKTSETAIPELDTRKLADGMRFHTELAHAERSRDASLTNTYALVGIQQPTATTARLTRGRIELNNTYQAQNLYGDSTVPIVAASRADVPMDSNQLRRIPDKHGNLQRNTAALDEISGILTASRIVVRAPDTIDLHVDTPELLIAGQDLDIHVAADDGRPPIRITITDETGRIIDSRTPPSHTGTYATTIQGLTPGAYTIDITGLRPGTPVAPVSSDVLVW